MGTLVEKNLLRAMMLEVLLKDNELLKDILRSILKEKPHIIEDLSPNQQESAVQTVEEDPDFPVLEGLTPERRKQLEERINNDFAQYHNVFQALA